MVTNPYLPSPSRADAWAKGFIVGFSGPEYSTEPPAELDSDDAAAYSEGVLAGQQAAINGLALTATCIPAREPESPLASPEHIISGVEILHGLWELKSVATLAGGLAGLGVAFIELACTLPVHTLPPEQVLPGLGQPIIDQLVVAGVDSMELYIGAGLDASSEDCTIRLSSLYKTQEAARQAVDAMHRGEWVVASWRTDASDSFRIVDSN
jgi:hypothetical protein